MGKIKSFQDLDTWKKAHELVLIIYKLSKFFPSEEKFGLTNQIRRAVVSIASNIAEGFGRKSSEDKKRFYIMAKTSLSETQSQLLIAKDLKYLSRSNFEEAYSQTIEVDKLLAGLLKTAKNHS